MQTSLICDSPFYLHSDGLALHVDLLTIGADGPPEAGDLDCHWGVDFWFIKADKTSSSGGILAGAMLSAIGL